jgi:hypothetical protein
VPTKTFAFDPNFDEVHLVLFEAYMRVSALAGALQAILAEEGHDDPWAVDMIHEIDLLVARAVRQLSNR